MGSRQVIDDRQLDLFATRPPPEREEPSEDVSVEPKELPPEATLDMDPLDYLRHVVKDGEYMIFMYEDQGRCFVRTHSSMDPGIDWQVDRTEAEDVLKGEYYFHIRYTEGGQDGMRSRVYIRDE